MEVSEEDVMKPDDNHKRNLSMSSDACLLEKARKLLRGNNTESSQSCSINSPLRINTQLALSVQSTHSLENGLEGQSQPRPLASGGGKAKSSISVTGSNQIEHFNKNFEEDYLDVTPEFELGGPPDDGWSWRKYGQIDVLPNKYTRSYYRCTYLNTHNCLATKQVKRSDDDPTVFEVTYGGTHTCNQTIEGSVSSSTPPEKARIQR
ncbi:hypothetical protein ACH5RR_038334 [Cinchona calisaya]|uniref:WRKY domain-containing protein n=1 Tax=Cinchona calisaya TaxID=153742 RepID=A0ABD2XXK8_9GENT